MRHQVEIPIHDGPMLAGWSEWKEDGEVKVTLVDTDRSNAWSFEINRWMTEAAIDKFEDHLRKAFTSEIGDGNRNHVFVLDKTGRLTWKSEGDLPMTLGNFQMQSVPYGDSLRQWTSQLLTENKQQRDTL